MKVFEISYDLRSPGRDYEPLRKAIKSYGTWCHPLESTWLVVTSDTAEAVRNRLVPCLDSNDGILVTALTGEAAWLGLSDEVSQWLSHQLPVASKY